MDEHAAAAGIEVLWRPGCPYCARLRRGLRRAGVTTVERDIWTDPAAAARVRAATGGDETVPTVLVGGRALVNPSVAEVLAAVRVELPDDADRLLGSAADDTVPEASPGSAGSPGSLRWPMAAGATLAAAGLWALLAVWRPSTTWHLGPVLVAAAAPWLIGQGVRSGHRRRLAGLAAAAAAGFLTAVAVTAVLSGAGQLRGPTLAGSHRPWPEALVLAAAAALLAAVPGAVRALQPSAVVRSAWLGGQLLARSADVVMVEGNAYFPAEAITPGALTRSETRSVCPWKGVAGYYTATVDGVEHRDVAWSYRHPSPLAQRIKGRVAFWGEVEIRVEPRSAGGGTPIGGDTTGGGAEGGMRP